MTNVDRSLISEETLLVMGILIAQRRSVCLLGIAGKFEYLRYPSKEAPQLVSSAFFLCYGLLSQQMSGSFMLPMPFCIELLVVAVFFLQCYLGFF